MGCGTSRNIITNELRKLSEPTLKTNIKDIENEKSQNPDVCSVPEDFKNNCEGHENSATVETTYGPSNCLSSNDDLAQTVPNLSSEHKKVSSDSNLNNRSEAYTSKNEFSVLTDNAIGDSSDKGDARITEISTDQTFEQSMLELQFSPPKFELQHLPSDSPLTPVPSGTPIIEESLENTTSYTLSDALHKACSLSDNNVLIDLSTQADNLRIDRTFYCFTKNDLLANMLYGMQNLKVLDLRGGQTGPIGFRAITHALLIDHHVTDLILSDNLATPECSESLGKLISVNKTIQRIDVSGNQLGKDALSRFVGAGLRNNSTLVSLDISSCGATDLHCLCESIRNSTTSKLTTLIASHNYMKDGHQFGVDLSLIIESANCCLTQINVTNTGITSSGIDAIGECLIHNNSLKSLTIGQNNMKNLFKLFQFLKNCISHPKLKEINLNKLKIEEIAPEEHWTSVQAMELRDISHLTHIGIADCGVTDIFVKELAVIFEHKLKNLQDLDISSNPELSIEEGFSYLDKLNNGNLKSLKLSLCEDLTSLPTAFSSCFSKLKSLDLSKSRLTPATLTEMSSSCQQLYDNVTLSGVKLSGSSALASLLNSNCCASLSTLHLSGCQLNDADVEPISSVLRCSRTHTLPLEQINLSVNRLTSLFLESMSKSMLTNTTHVLSNVDLSNNEIDGSGLQALMRLFNDSSHKSNINFLNLSCNLIPPSFIIEFFKLFKTVKFPLIYLDLRNQDATFGEDEVENLAELLKNSIFRSCSEKSGRYTINILGLGGSDVPSLNALDSSALRTDFVTVRNPTVALKDMLEIGKGLSVLNGVRSKESFYHLSTESWRNILGKEAPAWTSVSSDLSKAVYINRLPGTVTLQRLQGTLEMEADCEVKDVYLVKDPIMKKPTGAAWVLFEDIQSQSNAIDWYRAGNALMYGTPFTISEIPVLISDEGSHVGTAAEKEIVNRENEQKREMEREKKMMEESQQLAAERAEYREAHPAYQGGRIS